MAKWELVDNDKAPEDLSKLDEGQKERREILQALVPGKTIVVPVEEPKIKGYKAALSRAATKQKIEVEVWINEGKVCIKLKEKTPEKSE